MFKIVTHLAEILTALYCLIGSNKDATTSSRQCDMKERGPGDFFRRKQTQGHPNCSLLPFAPPLSSCLIDKSGA